MEAEDLDALRDKHIQQFLGKLMVRDLRHLARGRGMEDYQTMPKKDLASALFSTHFMQKRDKEKYAVEKDSDPAPNTATPVKGLSTLRGRALYDRRMTAPERVFQERVAPESHAPPLPNPPLFRKPRVPKEPEPSPFQSASTKSLRKSVESLKKIARRKKTSRVSAEE